MNNSILKVTLLFGIAVAMMFKLILGYKRP